MDLYTRWIVHRSAAHLTFTPEWVSPLGGSASLRLSNGGDTALAAQLNVHVAAQFPRGFTRGRLRCWIRVPSGTTNAAYGLVCLQSALNLTVAGTSCYALVLAIAGSSRTLLLRKYTNGLLNSPTTLATVASPAWTEATRHTLELQWTAGTTSTQLIARLGTAGNFSDLVPQLDHTDSTSPLTTSVAEGGCLVKTGVASDLAECLIDETTIYQL